MSKIINRTISKEEQVIGNLKDQFRKTTLRGQRLVGISPAIANGNIALSYHRGLSVGAEDRTKTIIYLLKKKFPKASEFIKNQYKK